MGKNDIYMKKYLSDKERFADLFNNAICHGKIMFSAENMREVDSTSAIIVKDKNGNESSVRRYRDIMMETKNGEKLLLLAVENQEEIHYAMPVRGMLYDALNYMEQVQELSRRNRRQKKLKSSGEYLSGLQKDDKIAPVITLIFYYGNRPWDGSKDVYGLLDMKEQELAQMKMFIPNYKMNLVDVRELSRKDSFKSDLQWILGMLQYKDNKELLIQYMQEHQAFFHGIEENTFGAAKALLGCSTIPKVPAKRKGEVDMCKALDDLYSDGVKKGIEQGIEQGIERGIERGIEQGQRQGFNLGEARLGNLCLQLLNLGKNNELEKVLVDREYRKRMYQEYGI